MFRFGDPGGRMYGAFGTANANLLAHWSSYVTGNTLALVAGGGRTSGSCLRFTVRANANYLTKTLDAQATMGIAFAFKPSGVDITYAICGFTDAGSTQVDLRIDTTGRLIITRAGTVLGTSTAVIAFNAWNHIEFKSTIHPTTGTAQVWLNGVSVLSLTAQNTRATANSTANIVAVGQFINGPNNTTNTWDYDDIIVYDGQTTDASGNAAMTGPIGDCGLVWLQPTGDGANTSWAPDTAGTHFSRVNEATPDITSYVEDSVVGHKDTYTLADLAANITGVKAVALCHYAEKTDVGSRQMGAVLRSGGTDFTHPTGVDLANSYAYSFRAWDSDPNGGTAWTPTKVNALEIGQIVNS